MPVDLYFNKTVEELLALLNAAQRRLSRGNVTEVTAAGVRVARDFSGNGGKSAEDDIMAIRYSLWLKDPDTYANPYAERIRRVRPSYL